MQLNYVYARSTTGANVTLPSGFVVGVVPVAIDATSSDFQAGSANRTITTMPEEDAKLLIAMSQIVTNTQLTGSNATEGNYVLTWAASAASGTAETVSAPLPTPLQGDALYLVSVQNPSALGTSVTVNFNNMINFGSGAVASTVTSVDIASGSTKSYLIQGWMMGDAAAQLSATNDAAVSSTGGSVLVQVRKV